MLAWVMNLGFAAGATDVVTVVVSVKVHTGAHGVLHGRGKVIVRGL